MKNFSLILSLSALLLVVLGCSNISKMTAPQAKPYAAEADNFYITFPSGSKEITSNPDPEASSDNKSQIYSTVNGSIGYRVKAIKKGGYDDDYLRENFSVKDVADTCTEVSLPWGDNGSLTDPEMPPKEAERKDMAHKGLPAIEASGWTSELSTMGNMFKRLRLVWDASNAKAYSIEVFSKKKDDLNSEETNKFFESFTVGKLPSSK